MKVNDPNVQGLGGAAPAGGAKPVQAGRSPAGGTPKAGEFDGVHLSSLARALRSLETDSPERQARVESLARAYAAGSYRADAQMTAGSLIDDALLHN